MYVYMSVRVCTVGIHVCTYIGSSMFECYIYKGRRRVRETISGNVVGSLCMYVWLYVWLYACRYVCVIVIQLSTSILRRCRYSTRCVCEAAEVFRVRPISAAVGARTPDRVGVEAVAVHEWNQSIQGSRSYFLNLRIVVAYIHTYIHMYIHTIHFTRVD